jgi:hypothetical protein
MTHIHLSGDADKLRPREEMLADTILEMGESLSAAKSRTTNLEAAIQRVRELHSRVEVWNECAVCTEHAEALPYPCPTIQALEGGQA